MKLNLAVAFSLLAFLLAFTPRSAFAGDCPTRHFYNTSAVTFTATLDNGGTCSIGPSNGATCNIPAGQTAELHYPNGKTTDGGIMIQSPVFAAKHYDVDANSCEIKHGGNTGNIVVNDPANGDVKTCGKSTYPCK